MKTLFVFVLLLASLCFSYVDTSTITVRKSDLPATVLSNIETKQKIENVGAWVGIGKEVGTAVKEGLGALTTETNNLANTKVGKFTMFVIAYKVLGQDLIQLFVGGFFLLVCTIIFILYMARNCIGTKIITCNNGKELRREDKDTEGGKTILAVFIYACIVGLCCAIIFV